MWRAPRPADDVIMGWLHIWLHQSHDHNFSGGGPRTRSGVIMGSLYTWLHPGHDHQLLGGSAGL
jgi:hypothetical protein